MEEQEVKNNNNREESSFDVSKIEDVVSKKSIFDNPGAKIVAFTKITFWIAIIIEGIGGFLAFLVMFRYAGIISLGVLVVCVVVMFFTYIGTLFALAFGEMTDNIDQINKKIKNK